MPATSCSAFARRPAGQRSLDVRAQPVGDATDPAPPADDPGALAAHDDVHAASREPPSFVEAGLGPTRRDRPRAHLEDGTLRRRPLGRQLEQDPLADPLVTEPSHLGRQAERERRASRRSGDDDAGGCRLAETLRQEALVERVAAQRRPTRGPTQASATTSERQPARDLARASDQHAAHSDASPIPSGGGRTHWPTAIPRQAAATSRAGQFVSTARRTTARRLTASPGRGAARCAPGRSRGRRRGPRPTGRGRSTLASRRIFCAVTGPIPGSSSSCSIVAMPRLTFEPGGGRARVDRRARRRAARHDHLLPVCERCREVDRREVCAGRRAARPYESIGDPRAVGDPEEARPANGADHVDDEACPSGGGARLGRRTAPAVGPRPAPGSSRRRRSSTRPR